MLPQMSFRRDHGRHEEAKAGRRSFAPRQIRELSLLTVDAAPARLPGPIRTEGTQAEEVSQPQRAAAKSTRLALLPPYDRLLHLRQNEGAVHERRR